MSRDTVVLDDVEIVRETDAAILINTRDGTDEVWLPMSQVEEIHRNGGRARLVVTAWVARERGLV